MAIKILIGLLELKLHDLQHLELESINKGSYNSAAIYTGKIAAFNEVVKMLKEDFIDEEKV